MGATPLEQTGICYRVFYNLQVEPGVIPEPTYIEFTNVNGFTQRAVTLLPNTVQTVCSLTFPLTGDPTFVEITTCGECDGFCTEDQCFEAPPPPNGAPRETAFSISTVANPAIAGDAYVVYEVGNPNYQLGFTTLDIIAGNLFGLVARVNPGYRFLRWEDNATGQVISTEPSAPLQVATRNNTYTAIFGRELLQYPITITSSPTEGGTANFLGLQDVTVSSDGKTYSATVNQDAVVTITAPATAGYRFVRWQGGEVQNPTSPQTTIVVRQSVNLVAVFAEETAPPPSPSPTPPPASAPVEEWRLCSTGELQTGPRPADFREVAYLGAGGGTCWEPRTDIGFSPSLENLVFNYQRGSSQYPSQYQVDVINSSFSLSYNLQFETDYRYFDIQPRQLSLGPQQTRTITISVVQSTLNNLGDGQTQFGLNVIVNGNGTDGVTDSITGDGNTQTRAPIASSIPRTSPTPTPSSATGRILPPR